VLERDERDREVLDREAGRVERRDLVVRAPPLGVAREHRAELRDVVARRETRLDSMRGLAAVGSLFAVVLGLAR
jgi:hypothetical protein